MERLGLKEGIKASKISIVHMDKERKHLAGTALKTLLDRFNQ